MILKMEHTPTKTITTTYEVDSDVYTNFYIDTVFNPDEHTADAYLYHRHYGVKILMFSIDMESTEKELFDMIDTALDAEISDYIRDVIKEKFA